MSGLPPPPPPPPSMGSVGGSGHASGYPGPPPAAPRTAHQQMSQQQAGLHGAGVNSQMPTSQMPTSQMHMGYGSMYPVSFSPTYYGVTFAKVTDRATLAGRQASWALAKKTELPLSSEDLAKQVRAHRGSTRKSVWDEYAELRSDKMRIQIDTLLQTQRRNEQNLNADWTLASIEVKYRRVPSPPLRPATEAHLMTVILRRSPKNLDGVVDDAGFEIGGMAGETVDIDRPRFVDPRPMQFPNSTTSHGQLNQRMPGQQMQTGQGITGMPLQPQQLQQQHLSQPAFPQPPPPPGNKAGKMPSPGDIHGSANTANKAAVHQGVTPKPTKANGQPVGSKNLDYSDDDPIVHIVDGKNKTKKYPSVPPPPGPPLGVGKGQTLNRKPSLKNMTDVRRMSGTQEVLVVRDPKLTKVEKQVKDLKKALGRRNVSDSDMDSDYYDTSDNSYENDTPDSSTGSTSHSRRAHRNRRRQLSDSWNSKRRLSTERVHRKPRVTREMSPSTRRRMSLSIPHHVADPTVVEIQPPLYRTVQVPNDYQDRPLLERRGTYHDAYDFPRPRTLQRSLTLDNTYDMSRDSSGMSVPRSYADDLDERDLSARDYMARNNARARALEYPRRDVFDESRLRDSDIRALDQMKLDRLRNHRGDEELDRIEMRRRINDLDRYDDMLRLEGKMRNLRTDELLLRDRSRRGDGSIGSWMYARD